MTRTAISPRLATSTLEMDLPIEFPSWRVACGLDRLLVMAGLGGQGERHEDGGNVAWTWITPEP